MATHRRHHLHIPRLFSEPGTNIVLITRKQPSHTHASIPPALTSELRRTGRRPNLAFDDEPQIAIERENIRNDRMSVRKQEVF